MMFNWTWWKCWCSTYGERNLSSLYSWGVDYIHEGLSHWPSQSLSSHRILDEGSTQPILSSYIIVIINTIFVMVYSFWLYICETLFIVAMDKWSWSLHSYPFTLCSQRLNSWLYIIPSFLISLPFLDIFCHYRPKSSRIYGEPKTAARNA